MPTKDKRSGFGIKPSHDPLLDKPTDYSTNQNRLANVRWAPGTNPHDPLAIDHSQALAGWTDYKLDGPENPEQPKDTTPSSATDSGVQCFKCHSHNYMIIDKRSREVVAASRDDVSWALSQGRQPDPVLYPDVLMLHCPQCRHITQMDAQTVQVIAAKRALS